MADPPKETILTSYWGRLWTLADDVKAIHERLESKADSVFGQRPEAASKDSSPPTPTGSLAALEEVMFVLDVRVANLRAEAARFADL